MFRERAEKYGIKRWEIRSCDHCGASLGFVFERGHVSWDGACDCANFFGLRPSTWERVAQVYNDQDDPKVIKEMDKFWHFGPVDR
jgi:peptide methionine sulfoxide reductase MsrB